MPAVPETHRRFLPIWVGAALIASMPTLVTAHGDDQVIIDALTEELAKKPEAELFIRRGELYRHHQDWTRAAADYESAARHDPKLKVIDYFRGRLLLEAGAPSNAQAFVDRYVANSPDEPEAWFLQGEVRAALRDPAAAADSFGEGIRRSPRPRPEHYVRRAELQAAAAGANRRAVMAGIDEGIARLGPVLSLVDFAIALELEAENYAGALARIAIAMEHTPRRETWLVRQGDILVKAGRADEAVAAYRAALATIDNLPDRYRGTVPMEKLARDAREALERLTVSKK